MTKIRKGGLFSRISSPAAFKALCARFPATLCMVAALTLLLWLQVGDYRLWQARWFGTAVFYCSSGAILTLALSLWAEETATARLRRSVQTAAHVLWAANAVYLYAVADITPEHFVANAALVTALTATVFIGSFLRAKQDLALWHFALRTVVAAAVAVLIGLALWGGIALLLASLESLLDLNLGNHALAYASVACNVLLSSVLFLYQLPEGQGKHVERYRPARILTVAARYVLLPLLGAYLALLYFYALLILVRWELPEGGVSWPVTALVAGTLLWFVLLYPVRVQEDRKWDARLAHWLPVAVLPLLLLMTIGICRRLSDYGITAMRLYLLAFNLWCYGICAYLALSRKGRIRWILVSFAAIFLLTSTGPQSFMAVTRRVLTAQVRRAWEQTPDAPKFPMSDSTYNDWLRQLDDTTASRVDGKLDYLRDTYGRKAVMGMVDSTAVLGTFTADKTKAYTSFYWRAGNDSIPVPAGSRTMFHLDESVKVGSKPSDHGDIVIPMEVERDGKKRTVHLLLPPYRLHALGGQDYGQGTIEKIPCEEKDATFYMEYFSLRKNGETYTGYIGGYLFLR